MRSPLHHANHSATTSDSNAAATTVAPPQPLGQGPKVQSSQLALQRVSIEQILNGPRMAAQRQMLHAWQPSAAAHATQRRPVVQRRELPDALFTEFLTRSTSGPMNDARDIANKEDTVALTRVRIAAALATLEEFAGDELIGQEATVARQRFGEDSQDAAIFQRVTLITRCVDKVKKYFEDKEWNSLTPEVPADSRLKKENALKVAMATLVHEKLRPFLNLANNNVEWIETRCTQVTKAVTDMQNLRNQYAKGRDHHQKGLNRADELPALEERARQIGVNSPGGFEQRRASGERVAADRNWSEAGRLGLLQVQEINALEARVKTAEGLKHEYEQLAKSAPKPLLQLIDLYQLRGDPKKVFGDLLAAARDEAHQLKWSAALSRARELSVKIQEFSALADRFAGYFDEPHPKLLKGMLYLVWNKVGPLASNEDMLARLEATYQVQCQVTRLNWLTHLKIAGANVKNGSDNDHYTTFNDAIAPIVSLNVSTLAVGQLCNQLFNGVISTKQVHATVVSPTGDRYHRYWDGSYSANVQLDNIEATAPPLFGALNTRYDVMRNDLTSGVTAAKTAHGRVGHNTLGAQIVIP